MLDGEVLQTNEVENAIDYLEKAAYYYRNREDKQWFKWIMISLHGALYGFGICAIKGTNPSDRILKKPSDKNVARLIRQTKEYYKDVLGMDVDDEFAEIAYKYQQLDLLSILVVMKRCQMEDYMVQFTHSKILKLTELEDEAIRKLNNYRNNFSHFKPMTYAIYIESEQWIIKEVVNVVEFLALESGNIFYYNSDEDKRRISELLKVFS